MSDIIQFKRGTAALATSVNPLLAEAEMGYETDTRRMKVGDGTTLWNDLPYFSGLLPILDVEFVMDGGGLDITAEIQGKLRIPFDCTILAARLVTEGGPGDMVVDIYKGLPSTITSICAAAKPTLAAAEEYEDLTLTGWNIDVVAGEYLRYSVDSVSGVKWANMILTVLKFN